MNVLNIVMNCCIYVGILIFAVVYRFWGNRKNEKLFAVKLSKEQLENQRIKDIWKRYLRKLYGFIAVLSVVEFGCLWIPYNSVVLSISMIILLVSIAYIMVIYGASNEKVKAIKYENTKEPDEQAALYVDLDAVKGSRRVRVKDFIIPVIVSLVFFILSAIALCWGNIERTAGEKGMFLAIQLVMVFSGVLYYIGALWMDGFRNKVISSDSNINLNYNRAKKNNAKNMWLACIWTNTLCVAAFAITLFFFRDLMPVFIVIICLYMAATTYFAVSYCLKLAKLEKSYEDKLEVVFEQGDERCWIGGQVYRNPMDRRLWVENWAGTGMTLNYGRKGAGIFSIVFALVLIISVGAICIWMLALEFVPIELKITDDSIICHQLRNEYSISIDDIEDIGILDQLPSIGNKEVGVAMDNIYKGKFLVLNEEDGTMVDAYVYLNPEMTKFIEIRTLDQVYYISEESDQETLEDFEKLKQKL